MPRSDLATFLPLLIFVAGYFVRWGIDIAEKRRTRRKFFIALFTEIKLNTDGLRGAMNALPSMDAFTTFLAKDPKNRPHLISSYISDIYKSNLSLLPELPDILVKNIISYYGDLEFLKVGVASFENKSFETISDNGRNASISALISSIKAAVQKGDNVLDTLKMKLNVPDIAS